MTTLYIRDASGFREAAAADVLARARAILAQRFRTGSPALTSPALTREYLRMRLAGFDREVFGAIFLDVRHRVIAVEDLFQGTIDRASVYPREVVRACLRHNAAALIVYHNHASSGVAEPSQADELLTRRCGQALELIDVRILDHLVLGDEIFSFSEHGML